jgi:hypothetical protein
LNYLPVITKSPHEELYIGYIQAIIRQPKACLMSLIDAFKSKEFGLDTSHEERRYLRNFKKYYIDPCGAKFTLDSSGYSFIKGQIHPLDIAKMIECYIEIVENEVEIFDYFLSLDFPKSILFKQFNTYENILKYNRISLHKTFEMIERHPVLSDRFFFIWHFRNRMLYDIWKRLYDELIEYGYADHIKCRAIGGMVGIKGATGIDFSPFIALAFRCLKDYLSAADFSHDFRLHMLGINSVSDRFLIAFLEKLFERYLQEYKINKIVILSLDSIAYNRNATYQSRNLKVYSFNGQNLDVFPSPLIVPDTIKEEVYFNRMLYDNFSNELDRLKNDVKFKNIYSVIPLNLYSILQQNEYFEYIVEKYKLVDILFDSKGMHGFIVDLEFVIDALRKLNSDIFTKAFIRSVRSGMTKTYRLHNWLVRNGSTYEELDEIIFEFIAMIGAD